MPLPVILVLVAATFGFMFFMRRRLNTQYAHMRAGELAPRLGMQLLAGDPAHNLVTMSVQPSVQGTSSAKGFLSQMAATQLGGTLGELKLHMAGQPYGASCELMLYCRQDFEPGFTTNTTTTWHDLRLTVHAAYAVVPFDLRLRKETMHLETRRDDGEPRMPPQLFGDPVLDERFVIETPDPSLPRRIAGALGPFLHTLVYVHVTGAGNQVSFVMTPSSVTSVAPSLESILHGLVSIAAVFEGRPMPAPMQLARAA